MRILLLGPYPPPQGGIQTHLVALRNYLTQQSIPCDVINLTRHRRADGEGLYYPRTPLHVLRLLFQHPYDVAHFHIGGHLTPRLLALLLAGSSIPGKKTLLTFHSGGYPLSPWGSKAHPLTPRALILRRLDGLIGVNQEIADFYRRCGIASGRIRVISPYAPVSAPAGKVLPPPLGKFFGAHEPVLLSVGLLESEYDLPQQIRVLEEVRKEFPRAGLVIIGSGSLDQFLTGLILENREKEHILLCGDVPHDTTLLVIQNCSALLRTTLYDGDALSVREALQLGTPVIATDNGMRPEGVHLIPPSNLDALRTAISDCLRGSGNTTKPIPTGNKNLEAVMAFYRELTGT